MLFVELADSPSRQAQGLMFRTKLADNEGMLFIFKQPQKLRFWGVNTFIPLDIAYVNKESEIVQISSISPMSSKMVVSEKDCVAAVEANLGFFRQNKVMPGDRLVVNRVSKDKAVLGFSKAGGTKVSQRMVDWDDPESGGVEVDEVADFELPVVTEDEISSVLIDEVDDVDKIDKSIDQYEIQETTEQDEQTPSPHYEPPDEDYPNFGNVQDAASWATEKQEAMHIWYTTEKGVDIEREVEPHGFYHAKTTNNNILVTYDKTAGDIRGYIMDNVLYFAFTGEKFEKKFILTR